MAPMEHVYCFQVGSDNLFKVGRSKNPPEKRMRGFATGSPVKLNLHRDIETENSSDLETHIHRLLDEKRTENGEFFNVTAQELDDVVGRAVEFMNEFQPLYLQASALRQKPPNDADTMVNASDDMREIYRELRKLRSERYFIEQRVAFRESKIQVAIGDNGGRKGVASWSWVDRWTMDIERFRKGQDALYQQYKRNSGCQVFRLDKVDLTLGD
jgi:hypothetical protein